MSGSERYDTDSTATPRTIVSRWFLPLLAVISAGVTLLFIGFVSDDPLVSALFQGAFALVLAGVLFVVGYRYFTTTPLSKTKARTVALWTLAGFGLFVTMNVWFRFQAFVSGAPVEPEFAVSTSLTAGVLSGAVVGIAVARGHRRQAERERALADYREIFEQAEDGIVIHDPETREIAEINERGAEILGYPVEELEGTSIDAIYADDPDFSHEQAIERMQRALDGKPQQFDWLVERKDGTTVWVEVSLKRSTIGGEDRLIAIIRDVTERAERERRFDAVFNNTFQLTGLLGPDGTIVEINDTALEFAGNDRADVLGRTFWELPPLEVAEGARERVKEAVERAAAGEFVRFETAVGSGEDTMTIDTSITPVRNDHGDIEFLVAEGRDITERRENEQRLDALTKAFPDIAFLVDEDGRYNEVLASPANEDLLAIDPTEIVGNTVHDLFEPEKADEFLSVVQTAIETDRLQTLDYELDTPAGSKWFEARTVPLPAKINGKRATVTAARDVTERKEREAELEGRSTAMAASMEGIAILDGDGRYTYVNEAHADVYGYDDPEAFVGEHWHMCYDDEEIQAFEEEVLPALERDGQWRGEATGTRCDGSQFPQELTLTALENGGLVCVVRDITERTDRRRELERQNERLEQFASVLSHDLRNPLGVAEGYLELARDTGADEDFERIEHAHDRMERIVEDVLTLARQGKGISDTSTVDLASVAERAWSNVETDDAELSIGEDGCLGTIDADESRLEQLFENLFRNAIEHGGEGTTARVDRSSSGFFVEDDGPGIPVDEREQVFEHGHTTSENGTGFGLSIVETIAESHGWEISVDEGADGGARFEIGLGDAVRTGTDGLLADG